jgi:hypothetical protein
MIRVTLSLDGVEGYDEGCGCCGGSRPTNAKEIVALYNALEIQKQQLSVLVELLEEYGESQLVTWYRVWEEVRQLQADEAAGIKYSQDKTIKGTWYKDSFDKLPDISKRRKVATKELARTPALFRKYMKMVS